MKAKIEIDIGNAAFVGRNGELLADMLRKLADKIEERDFVRPESISLVEWNGNPCGLCRITR